MRFKLTKKSESRKLTIWGWLSICIVCIVICTLFARNIHTYLAMNTPVEAEIWVVEGHVGDVVIDSVVNNYRKGKCSVIFATGIPIGKEFLCDQFSNYADLNVATLIAKGVDSAHVHSAPCDPIQKDRSYASALALKAKLRELDYMPGRINIVSQGTHARRSYVLFKKALGEEWKVGCISYSDLSYNPRKWWKSSYGMRAVVYECLAYVYAILFFHPDE